MRSLRFGLKKTAISTDWLAQRLSNAAADPKVSPERMQAFIERQNGRADALQAQMAKISPNARSPVRIARRDQLLHQMTNRLFTGTSALLHTMKPRVEKPTKSFGGPVVAGIGAGLGALAAGYGAYRFLRSPQQPPPPPPQYEMQQMNPKMAAVRLFLKSSSQLPLPEGVNLDESPGKLNWKTPSGHTVRMPFREQTLQHHQQRLGPGAKDYLRQAVDRESRDVDENINTAQASWMNHHPRVRNGLIGGMIGAGTGGMIGTMFDRTGKGLLAGAGIGALLAQLGKQNIRSGPEEYDYADDYNVQDLPKAFYHLTPEEIRQQQHMDKVDDHIDAERWRRYHDTYTAEDRHREILRAMGGRRY